MMAKITILTTSSIRVKPRRLRLFFCEFLIWLPLRAIGAQHFGRPRLRSDEDCGVRLECGVRRLDDDLHCLDEVHRWLSDGDQARMWILPCAHRDRAGSDVDRVVRNAF